MTIKSSTTPSALIRERLRTCRETRQLSTQAMADLLQIPKRVYLSWEYGQRLPKLDALYDMALRLKLDPAWLAGFTLEQGYQNQTAQELRNAPTCLKSDSPVKGLLEAAASWLEINVNQLELITLEDDSMSPALHKGCKVIIKNQEIDANELGYFALSLGTHKALSIRHISASPIGGYDLCAANPLIGRTHLPSLATLSLYGRVVAFWQAL